MVKETHENGGTTGSVGYGCQWKREEASKNLLRTHTTAVSSQVGGVAADDNANAFFSSGGVQPAFRAHGHVDDDVSWSVRSLLCRSPRSGQLPIAAFATAAVAAPSVPQKKKYLARGVDHRCHNLQSSVLAECFVCDFG